MRSTLLFAALALALGTAEAAETQRYVVLTPEATIGHLHATVDGDTVSVDYDVKDNGRGPTMKETLRLSEAGLPVEWSISGATTFGSKVDERFAVADGKATWKDAVGTGEAANASGALYIGQSGTPWALGVYARALMADADGRIATLPGGELRPRRATRWRSAPATPSRPSSASRSRASTSIRRTCWSRPTATCSRCWPRAAC